MTTEQRDAIRTMRRLVIEIFAACALVIAVALLHSAAVLAQTPTAFPLQDASFEGAYLPLTECANITGEVAQGWSDNTCWDPAKPVIRYARDSANPHDGQAAQRITLVRGTRAQFAQFLSPALEAGRMYRVSLWMRAQSAQRVTVMLRKTGAPYTPYISVVARLGPAWSQVVLEGVTDATDVALLVIAEAAGTFWIDAGSMASVATPTAPPLPPRAAIPRSYFGMHFNHLDTAWPDLGKAIGTVRIWDAAGTGDGSLPGAQWSEINTSDGVYDWRGLDERLRRAGANGATLLYTLGGRTPRWASAQPRTPTPYGEGQCAPPASDAIWQAWVRAIATRYKGRIRLWEVWNEADLLDFYCGTPERLVALARDAYAILKAVDPANRVLSPGFSGAAGPGYLDDYLTLGGGRYADIVAYHFYVGTPEEAVSSRLVNLRTVLARHGLRGKPLWNTEQGWIEIPGPAPLPDAVGAAYVARAYLLNWAYGLARYYYYTWDNVWNRFPFTRSDGVTLAPAGVAYREVATWMTGKVMESITRDASGTYLVTLRDAQGARQRVLWNAGRNVGFTVPAAWGALRLRSVTGSSRQLATAAKITVTGSPVLLEEPPR